jgi:4'-phosphopantetheinyl transferase
MVLPKLTKLELQIMDAAITRDAAQSRLIFASRRDIHVWAVQLAAPDSVTARFERILAQDERDRAARFRFEDLRKSFILARATLRILLGGYLKQDPAGIQFKQGSKGKPFAVASGGIEFNASHSGSLAVFAFTRDCELGIDVEQIRPMPDIHEIADSFFCAAEAEELRLLPVELRERAFFNCWTRKEAYIKATGEGLSAQLNEFRVSLRPSEPARFIHIGHDKNTAGIWELHDLRLAPDYASALAYRDFRRPVSVFPLVNLGELPGAMGESDQA